MRILLIILLTFLTNNAFAFNYVRKLVIEKKIDEKYSAIFDVDYRNNSDRLFRRHYDISINRKFNNGINLAFKYRNIYTKENGQWDLNEKRPQIQVSKKFFFKHFIFEPRARHDYQIIDGDDINRTRLRLRAILARPIFHLTPLISNEFYYNINDNRYSQNRFEIGLIFPKYKNFEPSLFFREDSRYQNQTRSFEADQIAVFRVDVGF